MNLMIHCCLCAVKPWLKILLTEEIIFLDIKYFQEVGSWKHVMKRTK